MDAVDKKWIKALSDVSKQVETAGSGFVQVYESVDEDGVDATATLRHFLEVTCNTRVQPDHSGHKVPTGLPRGHDHKVGGVLEVNQPAPASAKAKSAK